MPNSHPVDRSASLMRVVPSDLAHVQALSARLGVTVVELMTVIQQVGTWIPAIERKLDVKVARPIGRGDRD